MFHFLSVNCVTYYHVLYRVTAELISSRVSHCPHVLLFSSTFLSLSLCFFCPFELPLLVLRPYCSLSCHHPHNNPPKPGPSHILLLYCLHRCFSSFYVNKWSLLPVHFLSPFLPYSISSSFLCLFRPAPLFLSPRYRTQLQDPPPNTNVKTRAISETKRSQKYIFTK